LCLHARDVMLAQITQLFGQENNVGVENEKDNGTMDDRQAMAEYLQQCLQQYILAKCQAPLEGEAFPSDESASNVDADSDTNADTAKETATAAMAVDIQFNSMIVPLKIS
jgi:hypothetical protein